MLFFSSPWSQLWIFSLLIIISVLYSGYLFSGLLYPITLLNQTDCWNTLRVMKNKYVLKVTPSSMLTIANNKRSVNFRRLILQRSSQCQQIVSNICEKNLFLSNTSRRINKKGWTQMVPWVFLGKWNSFH